MGVSLFDEGTPYTRRPTPIGRVTASRILRRSAGWLSVWILNVLARFPNPAVTAVGSLLLPLYIPFRGRTRERLRRLTPPVPPLAYYRMRLRLALLSLRHILGKPDGCRAIIEGGDLYRAALASGNPVALLGWHQGPVELLHRLPADHASRDGSRETGENPPKKFFLLTASAFSPALTEWITSGRRLHETTVVRPDDMAALRTWARGNGVLAVMVDQVPGEPEEWLVVGNGRIALPYPARLLEWITARNPVIIAVSVRCEPGNRIVFRYERIHSGSVKNDVERLMGNAINQAPEQYNWSYPKVVISSEQLTADS
jgi:lauroyl/myristoyl acyltransferase